MKPETRDNGMMQGSMEQWNKKGTGKRARTRKNPREARAKNQNNERGAGGDEENEAVGRG